MLYTTGKECFFTVLINFSGFGPAVKNHTVISAATKMLLKIILCSAAMGEPSKIPVYFHRPTQNR
jgi:hypothetical protein